MIDIPRAMQSERLMKALIGLTPAQFVELSDCFLPLLALHDRTVRKIRTRRGKPPVLDPMEKLFYILFYIRVYPTFDLAGWIFGVDKGTCNRWTAWFLPPLLAALGKELVLPARKARSAKELFDRMPEVKAVLIDGTERPRRRPKNPQQQRRFYSGKKKRHTLKNILITTPDRRVLVLSATREGKAHDYACLKQSRLAAAIPRRRRCTTDTGFLGIAKDYPHLVIRMPKKKPKGGELSAADRRRNLKISRFRIAVEHAISGVKRCRIVSDSFRNIREGWDDVCMEAACGIWNFYLKYN
jgi:hypothetical protein